MTTVEARPYRPAPGGTLVRKTRDTFLRLHTEFAPKAAADATLRLGLSMKMEAKSIQLVTGAQPSIQGGLRSRFSISPGGGRGFLGVDPLTARALVAVAFGTAPRPGEADLTSVERRVAEGFLEFFLSRLNALWETLGECAFHVLKPAPGQDEGASPQDDEETFVITLFEISLASGGYRLEVGLPLSFVKPLVALLEKSTEKTTSLAEDPKLHPVLKRKMEGVSVVVRAFLAEPDVLLREMADLEPGDVLKVGRLGAQATLFLDKVPLFRGSVGVLNHHRAIQISSVTKNLR